MMKAAMMACAQAALVAMMLSAGGTAYARGPGVIECVDGYPAPPFTNSCPTPARTYAAAETRGRDLSCAQRYRSFDPESGTYMGRDGRRHVCQ
ncbi:MAG: BA14K family protein [Pseudomonadota bacterium]|jgi:hypothetical protein